MSKIGIDWAKENGYGLVIALDCGIKEVDNIDYANSLDIDFVICDHHLPGEKLPDSIAILDPKQPGCNYPFKELSGCGLGFKLIQGIVQKEGRSQDYLRAYLDLVAVSTCCDIVPMVDENRILVHFGLEVLNNSPRIGLSALIDASGVKRTQVDEQTGEVTSNTLTVSDIVFGLGPRINAAGRVDSARQAVELLISKNEEEAKQKAAVLNENNSKRVVLDKEITEEAIEYVLNDPELMKAKSLVLFNKKWHKGVIGIVASRLIERFYKPTILLTESNGLATGSARSVDGFDIHRAIESCDSLLIAYGGHKYAAGLSLDPENIIKFRAKFEKIVSGSIDRDSMNPKIKIDATLDFNQITPSFYKLLKQFAPFGPGNFKPFFVARNVTDTGYSRVVGEKHLKLAVKQSDDKIFYGIAFSKGDYYDNMASKNTFDICYSLRENHWKGRTSLELDVKDIKFQ
ncbi:MAG: single-stranded-DNA-specific exonuclease RecJ [Bacteroidetes bacterium]|nr:single-stranded-DNA-specific exonuclease RecJ [Bacteroidota bacterium]